MGTEATFRMAFWLLLWGLLGMRLYFSARLRQAHERLLPDRAAIAREGRGIFAGRVVTFFLLLLLLLLYAFNSPWLAAFAIPLPGWLRWAGFVVGFASLALWTWALAALGKQWSPQLQLRAQYHLVTTGPYARVRHPLYTAMFGMGIAFALVSANWGFVALAIVMVAGLFARVPREEQMMIEAFGAEYQAYIQRTGRFFPQWK